MSDTVPSNSPAAYKNISPAKKIRSLSWLIKFQKRKLINLENLSLPPKKSLKILRKSPVTLTNYPACLPATRPSASMMITIYHAGLQSPPPAKISAAQSLYSSEFCPCLFNISCPSAHNIIHILLIVIDYRLALCFIVASRPPQNISLSANLI